MHGQYNFVDHVATRRCQLLKKAEAFRVVGYPRQDSIVGIVKDMSTFSDQMHVDPVLRGATPAIFIAVHQMQGDISERNSIWSFACSYLK